MKKNNVLFAFIALFVVLASCKKSDVKNKETVLYEADFSNDDSHWCTGTSNNGASASINNGYYTFKCGSAGGHDVWLSPLFTGVTSNTAVETSIKLSSTGGENYGNGGLLWNEDGQGPSDYISYYFLISYNGYFTVFGYPDGVNGTTYIDWTLSSAIQNSQFNTLRIALVSGTLHFYINNTEVYHMQAIKTTLDRVGLSALKSTTMQVDYFKAVRQ